MQSVGNLIAGQTCADKAHVERAPTRVVADPQTRSTLASADGLHMSPSRPPPKQAVTAPVMAV